jgi:predicted DNA binding CopG/RHH family protein
MRTHKPVSVSLPPDLFEAAEQRAAKLGFKRATYIQQLILADLKKAEAEAAPASKTPTKKRGAKRS